MAMPSSPSHPRPACLYGAPDELADYELETGDTVGSGGLGRVYSAVHRPTGRTVALKLGSSFIKEEGSEWVLVGCQGGRVPGMGGV